jgi:sugar lactone lactonase YvrE
MIGPRGAACQTGDRPPVADWTGAPDILWDAGLTLGECPVWDGRALWLLDCAAPAILRFDPETRYADFWPMPVEIGSFAMGGDGMILCALATGLRLYNPLRGRWQDAENSEGAPLIALEPGLRFNDGKCDPAGRFWVGSMPENYREPKGSLWRVGGGGAAAIENGFAVPNGPAWSPDGGTFLISDSVADTTWRYAFDAETGTLAGKSVFLPPKAAPGYPDGAAMDGDGCLWQARWDGGCIIRVTPDGKIDRTVPLPVSRVTSLAFGGPWMRTLFITTARIGLSEAQLAEQPHAGAVFALDVETRGADVARFAG